MKRYIYESRFTDGRSNFKFEVEASSEMEAEREAYTIVRGIDTDGYGCDENAGFEGPIYES